MKSCELGLAGYRLRQHVARGNRRASGGQGDCRTDQGDAKCRLQQAAKALSLHKVQAKHFRSIPFVVSPTSRDPFGCRKGVLNVAIAVTSSELFGISILGLPCRRLARTSGVRRRRISVQFATLSRPIVAADYAAAGRQAARQDGHPVMRAPPALLSPWAGER
jgi:hypothetical protein